ncbi:MAG: hypothetical protein EXR99_12520 [Gemmataceae bacterium]|nr:hypothetical protein [Gemmataceae bacterium]
MLGFLGLAAVSIPWFYNTSLRLNPEAIQKARELWLKSAHKNYDLHLLETREPGAIRKEILVKVRADQVEAVVENGQFLNPPERGNYSVSGILDRMESELQSARGAFITGAFSPTDGHPTRFVKRLGPERLEILLRLHPAGP